ncbi:hypothetical protein ACFLU1_04340 [Chloroflexota bacterium]
MLRIAIKTKRSPEEVIKQAVDFFGPNGYKLEIKEKSAGCAYFEGGGGGVDVIACSEGKATAVEFTSREWDYQVNEFIDKIH